MGDLLLMNRCNSLINVLFGVSYRLFFAIKETQRMSIWRACGLLFSTPSRTRRNERLRQLPGSRDPGFRTVSLDSVGRSFSFHLYQSSSRQEQALSTSESY